MLACNSVSCKFVCFFKFWPLSVFRFDTPDSTQLTSLSRKSDSISRMLWALSSGASPFSSVAPAPSSCLSGDWAGAAVGGAAASESSWKPNNSSRSMIARRALMRILASSSCAI